MDGDSQRFLHTECHTIRIQQGEWGVEDMGVVAIANVLHRLQHGDAGE